MNFERSDVASSEHPWHMRNFEDLVLGWSSSDRTVCYQLLGNQAHVQVRLVTGVQVAHVHRGLRVTLADQIANLGTKIQCETIHCIAQLLQISLLFTCG